MRGLLAVRGQLSFPISSPILRSQLTLLLRVLGQLLALMLHPNPDPISLVVTVSPVSGPGKLFERGLLGSEDLLNLMVL